MAKVIRFDAGALQKPRKTPQGFLRADGYASRVGIHEYRDGEKTDGIRRELRLDDDVFHDASLSGFEGIPVTDDHPARMVDAENSRELARGTVLGIGRRDGDRVAVSMMITDKALIDKIEAGQKRQLSVGYLVSLDETPGEHPVYGKYDAIQRDIVPNHLAVVQRGRGGSSVRVHMDGAWIEVLSTDPEFTSIVDGHQHTIEDISQRGGSTSFAMAEGADHPHEHSWKRDEDGSIVISTNAGHTHEIDSDQGGDRTDKTDDDSTCQDETLDAVPGTAQGNALPPANGVPISGSHVPARRSSMTLEEALAEIEKLKAKLAEYDGKAAKDAEEATKAEAEKAKAAEAKADALSKDLQVAQNAAKDAELAKAEAEKARKDSEDTFAARVTERVALVSAANTVLGTTDDKGQTIDRSAMSSRDLKLEVIKRVDGDDYSDDKKFDDSYVSAMFDGAIKRHAKGARAVAETAAAVVQNRGEVLQKQDEALAGMNAEQKAAQANRDAISNAWISKEQK